MHILGIVPDLTFIRFLIEHVANTTAIARTEGDIITVNGKEYVKLTKFEIIPQFGSLKVFATGLFPDPELSKYNQRVESS